MLLEVREKTGRKYTLFRDGERYCRCYPGDLRGLGFSELSEGQETGISEASLIDFEKSTFLPRAKRRALMLLGKKEYTEREMKKKLTTDGYPLRVTETVLDWLGSLRYVDDMSYAERYAFSLLSRQSEREIVQKMQQKGFEKELIKEALMSAKERYKEEHSGLTESTEHCESEEGFFPEQEAIRTFLRKKGYHPESADDEKRKKLMMALYRKGFSMSDIRTVLGTCEDEYDF